MSVIRSLRSWLTGAASRSPRSRPAEHRARDASAIWDEPVSAEAVFTATVEALARSIEARSHWSGGDLRRVQRHAVALARLAGLTPPEVEGVKIASLLHDVGTLAVPPHILAKPGPLTAEEFERVRAHPEVGARLLSGVPFTVPVVPLIQSHHERWDGKGYPMGLAGEAIPLGARVLAVADCYDSLRSPRPYRAAHSPKSARDVLASESGKSLDPRLVAMYLEHLPSFERSDDAERQQISSQAGSGTFAGIAQAQRESALLFELSQALASTLGVEETVTALLSRLGGLVTYDAAALFLAGDDGLLRCAAAQGLPATSVRILALDDDQAAPVRALRTGLTVLNGDPVRELVPQESRYTVTWRSSLVAPLVAGGRAFGALAIYAGRSHAFDQAQATTLERAAKHAAGALANARRFDQAQTDSLTDALTGLPNARFLTMHFTQELSRATRLGSQMALLIVDVDDFKRINDQAGHHIGDRVLREMGRVLRTSVRAYDVCARYAGDEFLVMLPECGVNDVAERLAQIEAALSRVIVEAGERRIRVRASVGAAVFPSDGSSFESLLASADRRMYHDKARARPAARAGGSAGADHAGQGDVPTRST